MNKIIFLSLLIISISILPPDNTFIQFQEFIQTYDKHYKSIDEFNVRYQIFKKNLASIDKNAPYEQGITKFSDLTDEEFAKYYLNYRSSSSFPEAVKKSYRADPPENFNWIDKKVLGPIRDQQKCGSCWAFAACGAMESAYYIKHEDTKTCSEQMLVDCDNLDEGCNGGEMTNAYMWVMANGGIMKNEDYPYVGKDGECKQQIEKLWIKVQSSFQSAYPDEEELKKDLFEYGPFAVGINATPLKQYKGGIFDDPKCDPEALNHGVVLVGYGVENGKNYWIVRNSWGEKWGENGYFRIARGKGMCGINKECSGVTVE